MLKCRCRANFGGGQTSLSSPCGINPNQDEPRSNTRKRKTNPTQSGFTLAEVLITLGIIGVVAALTLPTLMNNVQDKVLESQRQKAASVLANGYKKMLADNAVFSISDTPLASVTYTIAELAVPVQPVHQKTLQHVPHRKPAGLQIQILDGIQMAVIGRDLSNLNIC